MDKPKLQFENLPPNAAHDALTEAKKEGVFAGLTGGLASAVLGARLLGFKRNKTLFCGIPPLLCSAFPVSGVLSGYYFSQAFTSTALAQLHAENARLKKAGSAGEPPSADFLTE